MTVKRIRWSAALGVVFGLPWVAAAAEDVVWRTVARTPPPPAVVASTRPAAPAPAPRPEPAATLGRPCVIARPAPPPAPPPAAPPASGSCEVVVRAQAPDPVPPAGPYPPPAGPDPSASGPPDSVPPPSLTPTGGADLASGVGATPHSASGPPDSVPPPGTPPPASPFPPGEYNPSVALDRPLGHTYFERMRGWFQWGDRSSTTCRGWFQSDPDFPHMISPVTMPFFFEDPRSLTEIRPIFMYQGAPSGNPIFRGGHSEFFGTQARLAFTDRLSLVINELGFVSLNPNAPADGVTRSTGFANLLLGPKYTFLRNCQTGSVMAAGLTFEVPTGSRRVFQNTGNLGLDPYITYGQTFPSLPAGWGSLNFLAEAGYSFGVDNKRSGFFNGSLHLDWDIANNDHFFPLVELHYLHYTRAGRETSLGFEGADLVNFGSNPLGGRDYLSLAAGLRYKCSEHLQFGGAVEWPVTRQQGLADYRLTFDVIFRY